MTLIDKEEALTAIADEIRALHNENAIVVGEKIEEIGLRTAFDIIKRLPIVKERPKGKWIDISRYHHSYKCSLCGRTLINITDGKNNVAKHYPFCHCGADMKGDK